MYELICDQDAKSYEYINRNYINSNKKILLSGYDDNIVILHCKYGNTHSTTPRSIIASRIVRDEYYWTHIKDKEWNNCRICEEWPCAKYRLLSDTAILCENCVDSLNGDTMMAQELPHFGNKDEHYQRIEYAKNVIISESINRLIFWDRRSYYVISGVCSEVDQDLLGIVERISDIKDIDNITLKRDYILRTLLSRLSLLRNMIIWDIAQIVSRMMIDTMCVKLMISP